jgi:hypothetical protein
MARELTREGLASVRSADLRQAAAEALARGERALLVTVPGADEVETLVLPDAGRAAQSTGGRAIWGEWREDRLHVDQGDHVFAPDGSCVCRECEAAADLLGEDAE